MDFSMNGNSISEEGEPSKFNFFPKDQDGGKQWTLQTHLLDKKMNN